MLLNKEKILAAADKPTKRVNVPEWGGHLFVRTMSAGERDAYEAETYDLSKGGKSNDAKTMMANARARLLVRTLVDEEGTRLFEDSDVEALGQKSGQIVDRVFTVASKLNGLSAADVDELVGNSKSGPTGKPSSKSANA